MLVLVRCWSFTPIVPKGYGFMSSEDMRQTNGVRS